MSVGGRIEREQKLAAWTGFEVPDLSQVEEGAFAVGMPEQHLDATYYDTSDLRLARSGVSVRCRTGELTDRSKGLWTVKFPSNGDDVGLSRREIDVPGPPRHVPDEVSRLVRARVRSSQLVAVGSLHTRRRRVELRCGDRVLVEVADDEVSVLEGRRVAARFRELEVELREGTRETLERVVRALRAAGASTAEQTPKIVRALGPRALEPPDIAPRALSSDASVRDVIAAATVQGLDRLVRHDPGMRLGGDIEDVHQSRVAARRLRSDLRTFSAYLDADRIAVLREELQWLGGELGVVRDGDVLAERLRGRTRLLPAADARAASALLRRLDTERASARSRFLGVLDQDRYIDLLDALAAAAIDPPLADDDAASQLARKALPDIVRRPWKHLSTAVSALPDHPDDSALHEIRIRAKRTRYAAEAAAGIVGRPAARFAKAVASLQGVLGDLQDAVVAEVWLRAVGSKGTAAHAFVAGELVAMERAAMDVARNDWRAAWEDVATKKLRGWLS